MHYYRQRSTNRTINNGALCSSIRVKNSLRLLLQHRTLFISKPGGKPEVPVGGRHQASPRCLPLQVPKCLG